MDTDFISVVQDLFIEGADALIYKTERGSWLMSSSLKSIHPE